MRASVVTLLAAASLASAQAPASSPTPTPSIVPAPKVTGNPAGVTYLATLPTKEGSTIRGSIQGASAPDGVGVKFSVSFSGLPSTGGPFLYHIHEKPVPADGNCTGTGAHLDPYKRGEVPPCDATKPETCQTGDLSGKHGTISGQQFAAEYVDPYSATRPDSNAFFGNLSFVLHLNNKTRIGCANFSKVGSTAPTPSYGTPLPSGNATASVVPTPASPSQPAQYSGAANRAVAGAGAMLVAAALAL